MVKMTWALTAASIAFIVIWFAVLVPDVWRECRDAGHTKLYCYRVAVR